MKRMKKTIAILLAALMLMMVGCGSNDTKKVLDPVKVAEDMKAVFVPQGELLEVADSVLDNYYTLDPEVFNGHRIYISTSFIAEEIAVFGVREGKTEEAKKVLEQRLTDLKASFDGYLPDELASLNDNAKILENGNLLCLLAGEGDGRTAAEKAFLEA